MKTSVLEMVTRMLEPVYPSFGSSSTARRRHSSRRCAALRGMARRRSPSSPIMLIQQSTYLPNCWNLVFGQKDGGRRSHRSKLEGWKPSDCTSRTNQHHDDVAPAESRAMIGRTHILSLSLPPPFLSLSLCHSPFPRSLQPLVRTPETRWRRGLGVIGRISVIVAPTVHPLHPLLSLSLLPSPFSLSLSLLLSLLPFRPPRHPSYTAVNRVYPLAVAQPFNQTD